MSIVLLAGALAGGLVRAADLQSMPQPTQGVADPTAATADYIHREAVLLMIRASFDVVDASQIGPMLADELKRIGPNGPGDYDLYRLDRDLRAEASYYLVSLRYLIEVGGAAWPADRPENNYANDALVELDSLQDDLDSVINSRGDPLPVLERAQKVMLQTEGYAAVPTDQDHFAGRDDLVNKLMAEQGPRTST